MFGTSSHTKALLFCLLTRPKEEERAHPREDVMLVVDLIGQVNVQKEKPLMMGWNLQEE